MERSLIRVLAFGKNDEGQLGLSNGEDTVSCPTPVFEGDIAANISRICMSAKQSFCIFNDGSVCSCGQNENNELGRSGKRSVFTRIDAVETFRIGDVCCGDGFVLMSTIEGKLICWGRNESGQLGFGAGMRSNVEKPKINSSFPEPILQLACGSSHAVALTRAGNVLTWGGNRMGQLGDGQLTSSCDPRPLPQLRHRPIVSISCGEAFTLACTVSGMIFAWGENSSGQLGLGDTTHRLRPELVRALRTSKVKSMSTGRQHSCVFTHSGLAFAFGSNASGQCGLGENVKIQTTPVVIERLRDAWVVINAACGSQHTLIVAKRSLSGDGGRGTDTLNSISGTSEKNPSVVFVMGSNSCGQLGISGNSSSVYTPKQLSLRFSAESGGNLEPIDVSCSALSFHSFIFVGVKQKRVLLPAVELSPLLESVAKLKSSPPADASNVIALRSLREQIAFAFSSVSVMNASFHLDGRTSGSALTVNLAAARSAYTALFSTEREEVIATLGRATLQLADHLKEIPFDDSENLSVFLLCLENPLMLSPESFHVAIERVITGILSLPKQYRLQLFSWLRGLASEYFARVVNVMQAYLTYCLTAKVVRLNPAPVVLVLSSLYQVNCEAGRIVPDTSFYNDRILRSVDIGMEWQKFKEAASDSKVFNFCQYPCLISLVGKNHMMRLDFAEKKRAQHYRHIANYLMHISPRDCMREDSNAFPMIIPPCIHVTTSSTHTGGGGAGGGGGGHHTGSENGSASLVVSFEMTVYRETLLDDVLSHLRAVLAHDKETLRLPLICKFIGEEGVDQGGVRKELLSLAIKQFVARTKVLGHTSAGLLWFKNVSSSSGDDEFILGLLVGLAAYNDVLVDVHLPSAVYKIFSGITDLTLEDMFDVDPVLARGLQQLLEWKDDDGVMEDALGVTFTASSNPLFSDVITEEEGEQEETAMDVSSPTQSSDNLASNNKSNNSYIELIPGGSEVYVSRSNRSEFSRLFIQHSLYNCCKKSIDSYLNGIWQLFLCPTISICNPRELSEMLEGSPDIGDLSELRLRTRYLGEIFHDEHEIIHYLWDTLSTLSGINKRLFIKFVTGSDRIPAGGIAQLQLTIQSISVPSTHLPVAHTCFNLLDLPISYENRAVLEEKLLLALKWTEGFGLV